MERGIAIARIARVWVQKVFLSSDPTTKHQIASVVTEHFPELAHAPATTAEGLDERGRTDVDLRRHGFRSRPLLLLR